MINVDDVIKIYKTGTIEVVALRGLTLQVRKGEFVAIMGPSGCGKTTLLNLISGIDRPTAGRIEVNHTNLTQLRKDQASDFRAQTIGFIFQFFNLIPQLTARENIELPMRITGTNKKQRQRRSQQLLELVDLEDRAQHKPSQLSGGEQQRTAIATALANQPPIILADEPTGEIDTQTGKRILKTLKELAKKENKTILTVTHDTRTAQYADRTLTILDGKITTP